MLLVVLTAGPVLHGCSGPAPRSDLTPDERREDLSFVATVFAQRERSFTPQTRATFEARIEDIDSRNVEDRRDSRADETLIPQAAPMQMFNVSSGIVTL